MSESSDSNNEESIDSSESVEINDESDDNVSLFSNDLLVDEHFIYFGYHLLRSAVTHETDHPLAKVIDDHYFTNCIKLKRMECNLIHGVLS